MPCRSIARVHTLALGLLMASSVPAAVAGQAKGSAESTAAANTHPGWQAPRTPWGHPDLQGLWTTDDMRGVPMQRPEEFGTRRHLTDEAFAERVAAREEAFGRSAVYSGTFRNEEGTRIFGYTSLVVDPPDGRVPAMTPAALARQSGRARGSFGVGPFNSIDDFSLYDRCITRGLLGSTLPVVYGNGARILQTPDSVVISYEMVHETRVIPLDGRPHLGSDVRQYMGDARGHWEGDTLVVETTNFTDQTSIGPNGGGARHSAAMRLVERFTRVDPEMVDYEVRIEDLATYTAPWTLRLTFTQQPDYQIFEYACHEGNRAVGNTLSGERAWEREAAQAAAKGLPPPPRVFEQVNSPDRAR